MLPRDETAFFGRAAEIAEVERLLASPKGGRLVTIVGLGGVGKSRLALEVASRRESVTPGSVFIASLAESGSVGEAVRVVASAIPSPGRAARRRGRSAARATLEALAADVELLPGAPLLVLENAEGLGAEAKSLVASLLDRSARLSILVTSREPTGARAEQRVVLAPMNEPDAVALLRERARAVQGDGFAVADEVARAIVSRVDRLPLAIELAACRLEVLSPEELLRRLSSESGSSAPLDVLTDPSGATSPVRPVHRTMRAALDASWELLDEPERHTLVQVSTFAVPFGIEAAEEIVGLPGRAELDEPDTLSVLENLVRRSLLFRVVASGRARLGMLETVKSWAREKLPSEGGVALDDVRLRHARYHLAEAERAAAGAYGEEAPAALDRLEALLPELAVAFDAVERTDPAAAARIPLALADLALFRGPSALRAELFARGRGAAEASGDPRLLARSLVVEARIELDGGRVAEAESALGRAVELAAAANDDLTLAEATRSLGWALSALGRPADAELHLLDAERMHRAQGSARGLADAYVALGIARALQGRSGDGLALLRQALAIHVAHGDVIRQEKVLGFAALVGHDAKEVARGLPREVLARAPRSSLSVLPPQVAEALASSESTTGPAGPSWRDGLDLYRTGVAAYDRGDPVGAVGCFERARDALERSGIQHGRAIVHGHLAVAHARSGDREEALTHLALARASLEAITSTSPDPVSELAVTVFAAVVDVVSGVSGAREVAGELLPRLRRAELGTTELSIALRVLERSLEPPSLARPPVRGADAETTPLDVSDAPRAGGAAGAAVLVGPESRWLELPDRPRIDLVRYGPIRKLLDRLVVARLEMPGQALTAEDLIAAGWPGERMRHTAGLLRVYSAVRRLRRLGLDEVLVTRDDGYLFDPNAPFTRAS